MQNDTNTLRLRLYMSTYRAATPNAHLHILAFQSTLLCCKCQSDLLPAQPLLHKVLQYPGEGVCDLQDEYSESSRLCVPVHIREPASDIAQC